MRFVIVVEVGVDKNGGEEFSLSNTNSSPR